MRAMVNRGHEVTVLADQTPQGYEIDGVTVLAAPKLPYIHDWVKEQSADADLIITHLDCSGRAMNLSIDLGIPLVHFVHNSMQLRYHAVKPHKAQLVVFNSHWVKAAEMLDGKPWPGESIVIHPIVEPEHYRCERGDMITLVNPTPGKGAETFYALAKAMPHRKFLTVKGCYGEQVAPPNMPTHLLNGAEVMEHTPDIREVLRKTKVLLMPSDYESYGRIAIEAACAGIPTIAHPTPGLKESLGEAGIFCERAEIKSGVDPEKLKNWITEIDRLCSDDLYYRTRSDLALKLANSLEPESEFDRLEIALVKTVTDWQAKQEKKVVKMWTPPKRLWELTDGRLVYESSEGRIPQDALRQWGIEPIPFERAVENGLVEPEAKAIAAPAENKAIESPSQTKKKKKAA
jgi:hypothetical protein